MEAKGNPYVRHLASQLLPQTDLEAATIDPLAIAQRFYDEFLAPKNKRIHELTSELMKLQSSLHRLDKVLAVHNAGVCRDGEPPVDCAIRLLSPVPDTVPKRDRP